MSNCPYLNDPNIVCACKNPNVNNCLIDKQKLSQISNGSGLTIEDYVNDIMLQLGGPIIEIEIKEQIPKIVEMSFNELRNYITDVKTMTIPYSNCISLKGKDVNNIIYIMRGANTIGPGGFQDVMFIYSTQSALGGYTLTDYARALLVQQNKAALSTDLDFHYDRDEEKLYVYAQQALPSTITIVYTPIYHDVSEITEPFWQNLLRRLSVAHAKEILGRVRSKYKLSSATYDLDGDQLLSEARQELSEIRTYLDQNTDLILPID